MARIPLSRDPADGGGAFGLDCRLDGLREASEAARAALSH
jgi:hypothetical protein